MVPFNQKEPGSLFLIKGSSAIKLSNYFFLSGSTSSTSFSASRIRIVKNSFRDSSVWLTSSLICSLNCNGILSENEVYPSSPFCFFICIFPIFCSFSFFLVIYILVFLFIFKYVNILVDIYVYILVLRRSAQAKRRVSTIFRTTQ